MIVKCDDLWQVGFTSLSFNFRSCRLCMHLNVLWSVQWILFQSLLIAHTWLRTQAWIYVTGLETKLLRISFLLWWLGIDCWEAHCTSLLPPLKGVLSKETITPFQCDFSSFTEYLIIYPKCLVAQAVDKTQALSQRFFGPQKNTLP